MSTKKKGRGKAKSMVLQPLFRPRVVECKKRKAAMKRDDYEGF